MAGLYVHVPFRSARRPYDDSSSVVTSTPDAARFATALSREVRLYAQPYAAEEPFTTAYVGGGRPSLLPLQAVQNVLRAVVDGFEDSSFDETTIEVAPADATIRYTRTLKRLGFTRLSLGLLSFSSPVLRAVDAPHSPEDAERALAHIREAGFKTVSVDLLFGLPHQSLTTWESTLRRAIELDVPHITLLEAPGNNETARRADQLEFAMTVLRSEGYEQYELTHFARPGHRSAHQENYYAHGNYVGIGPSAQSFWWPNRPDAARARRWTNEDDVDRYAELLDQRHPPTAHRQTLPQRTLAQEYVFLRLRTDDGLDLNRIDNVYGVDLRAEKSAVLDRLRRDGLIHEHPDDVRLTTRGRLLTDAITRRLLPS